MLSLKLLPGNFRRFAVTSSVNHCRSSPHILLCVFLNCTFVVGLFNASTSVAQSGIAKDTILHSFTGNDGGNPWGRLVQGRDGYLYGTTPTYVTGGTSIGYGTVFKISTSGAFTTLHLFAGTDGAFPVAGLGQGTDGNFYGLTQENTTGAISVDMYGTVFRITPSGSLTTTYAFGAAEATAMTGSLVQGTDGSFYGADAGGGAYGTGRVFKITPGGSLSTLYSFHGITDGVNPTGSVLQGTDGNFYGTTLSGGALGYAGTGTVYKITPSGVMTILHSFGANGDGGVSATGMVQGKDGSFYGTTQSTVFRVTPSGTFTTLHSFGFAATNYAPCTLSPLTQGSDGDFYGASATGGDFAKGAVFKITSVGVVTILYSFGSAGSQDAILPCGGVIQGRDGDLYGVSRAGGATASGSSGGNGAVYKISLAGLTLGVTATDPIADGLQSGSGLVTDPSRLSAASHVVTGVAADSATQVLIQISGPNAGDQIQLTLADENGPSGNGLGTGYLTPWPANGSDTRNTGGTMSVTAVDIGNGSAMAFAVYHAATDFVRAGNSSDTAATLRQVTIQATNSVSGIATTQSLAIVRPPVLLLHGLWSGPSDFMPANGGVYGELQNSQLFYFLGFARFDTAITVTGSDPSYSVTSIAAQGNSLGFKYGARVVLPTLQQTILDYKKKNASHGTIAVVQADMVAHSMGGDITRAFPQIGTFADQNTYTKGYVHKLITLDTPHDGTPLAPELLAANNSCVRKILGNKGRYAFLFATVNSANEYGAVGDLQPSSDAITAIHTAGSAAIPTAMIGGRMSSTQLAGAGGGLNGVAIKVMCANPYAANPLAKELNSTDWPTLMGGDSDGVVPLLSQFDGDLTRSLSTNTFYAVHSSGIEELGFLAPSIFDQSTGAPAEVVDLLNTPVSNTAVFVVKP